MGFLLDEKVSGFIFFGRRFFSIMAAGFFLPDSTGIADPCEVDSFSASHFIDFFFQLDMVRIQDVLTPQQQDEITATCGALLRLLAMGGHREILGHVPDFKCGENTYI